MWLSRDRTAKNRAVYSSTFVTEIPRGSSEVLPRHASSSPLSQRLNGRSLLSVSFSVCGVVRFRWNLRCLLVLLSRCVEYKIFPDTAGSYINWTKTDILGLFANFVSLTFANKSIYNKSVDRMCNNFVCVHGLIQPFTCKYRPQIFCLNYTGYFIACLTSVGHFSSDIFPPDSSSLGQFPSPPTTFPRLLKRYLKLPLTRTPDPNRSTSINFVKLTVDRFIL